jgi:hypothetical protein
MFKKLDNSKKLFLSTGKCIDNELFVFGIQCFADHPSRSLIIDPYDENYAQYKAFTAEELEETKEYQKKPMPFPTKEFKTFLNSYNLDFSQKIRTALGTNHQFRESTVQYFHSQLVTLPKNLVKFLKPVWSAF